MKYEEMVEQKHHFEDRVSQYLDLLSRLTERELELVMARLLDNIESMAEGIEKCDTTLMCQVIKSYLELRRLGVKERKKGIFTTFIPEDKCGIFPKRDYLNENDEQYRLRCATETVILTEKIFAMMNDINETPIAKRVKLLAP